MKRAIMCVAMLTLGITGMVASPALASEMWLSGFRAERGWTSETWVYVHFDYGSTTESVKLSVDGGPYGPWVDPSYDSFDKDYQTHVEIAPKPGLHWVDAKFEYGSTASATVRYDATKPTLEGSVSPQVCKAKGPWPVVTIHGYDEASMVRLCADIRDRNDEMVNFIPYKDYTYFPSGYVAKFRLRPDPSEGRFKKGTYTVKMGCTDQAWNTTWVTSSFRVK